MFIKFCIIMKLIGNIDIRKIFWKSKKFIELFIRLKD
jgi:hypothetical protein